MLRSYVLTLLLVSLYLSLASSAPNSLLEYGSVYLNSSNGFYFVAGLEDEINAVAYGYFNNTLNVTGWGVLKVTTNYKFGDKDQMYAAGYLEGALTSTHIYNNYLNLDRLFFHSEPVPDEVQKFFEIQDAWSRAEAAHLSTTFFTWKEFAHLTAQFDGLVAGYAATASQPLPVLAFQIVNAIGDLLDLLSALQPQSRVNWRAMNQTQFELYFARLGRCSALVKLLGDYSDLFAAHSSWFVFEAMERVYKHYNFQRSAKELATQKMSFSSYAGTLSSLDDFYIMDSGLVMIQTTNNIFNQSLYDFVTPQNLWAWQRVRLANSLAQNGSQWASIVAQYNSGTYNNQYMVIDYNLFTPGSPLVPNTLWVVEQIPSLVVADDLTELLSYGYFPSYNIPYFPLIFNLSGYPDIVKQYGFSMTHQLAPRAQIFRRDQASVEDFTSLLTLMRSNDYLNDPYSLKDPMRAICARGDLVVGDPQPSGCYDTKATSYLQMKSLQAYAISAPTYGGPSKLPPFSWKNFNETKYSHAGLPDVWAFDFIQMDPQY